jgi:hypothetical protein
MILFVDCLVALLTMHILCSSTQWHANFQTLVSGI